MENLNQNIENHYLKEELFEDIISRLKEQGINLEKVKRSDIAGADEFHVRGAAVSKELANSINLNGVSVLDVGCANGYHCFRMLEQGPKTVVGVDPSLKYVMQFLFLNKYADIDNMAVLPLGIDDVPLNCECFDTVFSMGLLYHRRSPYDHLIQLYSFLKEGGELVLETIVCDGGKGYVLMPEDRYAQMPNIWFIPSVETLKMWLEKCRFKDVKIIDVSITTEKEQRSTEWAGGASLKDFLDPKDNTKTVEGHPAPKRAILIARK